MRLASLTVKNFQGFGPDPVRIDLDDMTFLLGPNGAGKTAVLQAAARMFSVDSSLRGIRATDFHARPGSTSPEPELWIEAEFTLPEAGDPQAPATAAVPEFLNQMQLESVQGPMTVRIRLTADLDVGSEVTEQMVFVRSHDDSGQPKKVSPVDSIARRRIQLHYLPARRNPRDQISYAATSLLGNALRSADWLAETEAVQKWNTEVTEALAGNAAIGAVTAHLGETWSGLHKGSYLANPSIAFGSNKLDFLLRQLTINFAPSPQGMSVGFEMLSDGQQSLLYVTTIIALHRIGRDAVAAKSAAFDVEKLRPPAFTMFAVEEPENSLSPFYLGRIFKILREHASDADCQSVVATHSPAVVKRVDPGRIRFLRQTPDRTTAVTKVALPSDDNEARKYIQQAVEAYPELYFARLVVLGEGPSEQVFLPRLFAATGAEVDEHSLAVVPLGGRHVNHMWRLLNNLGIPHLTLLDLDRGRYGGGWGRLRTAVRNLKEYAADPSIAAAAAGVSPDGMPKWDQPGPTGSDDWLKWLESAGVFFSAPLDLDFMLLEHYPTAYPSNSDAVAGDTAASAPAADGFTPEALRKQVLGARGTEPAENYSPQQRHLFDRYHSLFQLGSKPSSHLLALSNIDDAELLSGLPPVMARLVQRAAELLAAHPE